MAIVKSHTDIEQSRKLAEFLPLESADMCFVNDGTAIKIDANSYNVRKHMWKGEGIQLIPCWSVAGLMHLLPSELEYSEIPYRIEIRKHILTDDVDVYQIAYGNYHWDEDGSCSWLDMINSGEREELIDACYKMIITLKEKNLL